MSVQVKINLFDGVHMPSKLMLLPSKDPHKSRLLRVPEDFEEHEIYRVATGIIAGVEEQIPDYDWDDIIEMLEEHGFTEVEFILGPEI